MQNLPLYTSKYDKSSDAELAQAFAVTIADIRLWRAKANGQEYRPSKWDYIDWSLPDETLASIHGVQIKTVVRRRSERFDRPVSKDITVNLRVESNLGKTLSHHLRALKDADVSIKNLSEYIRTILLSHVMECDFFPQDKDDVAFSMRNSKQMQEASKKIHYIRTILREQG